MANESGKAEFNIAISDLERLNYWFGQCEMHQYASQLQGWWHSLINTYGIIDAYLDEAELKDFDSKLELLERGVSEYLQKARNNPYIGIPNLLHKNLRLFYRNMRRMGKKYNLLMKFSDDGWEDADW